MARDGSGTYSRVEADYVAGTTIDQAQINAELNDMASALTGSLAKNGETVPTANQPMGTFKHTGVGDGTAKTDYASLGQVAKGTLFYAADTGVADAYVVAPSPGIAANVVGFKVRWKVTNANLTTTPTLAANSLTAGTIVWPNGDALAAGDLPANAIVETAIASLASTTPTWHLQTISLGGKVVTAIQNSLLTTRGDIITRGASAPQRLAVGADHTVLKSNGTDPAYGQVDLTADVTGIMPIANGGTGVAALARSIAANGYLTLPGGAIIQWGVSGSIGGSSSSAISLPLTFPNAIYSAVMTCAGAQSSTQASNYIDTVSTSGFTIHNQGASSAVFYWFAVGS